MLLVYWHKIIYHLQILMNVKYTREGAIIIVPTLTVATTALVKMGTF